MANKDLFFNRELSWLEFNARVLSEACRKEVPLLEQLQFLAIVSSNFSEFFQVRVASIKNLEKTEPLKKDSSGYTPTALLKQISNRCHKIMSIQYKTLYDEILPQLAAKGAVYIKSENYSQSQIEFIRSFFKKEIFSVLTPLRTDMDQFPHIANMNLHAAFLLKPIPGINPMSGIVKPDKDDPLIAVVPIPSGLQQIIWFPSGSRKKEFTLIEDIITQSGTELFPGYNVSETMLFKVARDADFPVDEDAGDDFVDAMKEVIIHRKSSFAVRLLCNNSSPTILKFLADKLNLSEDDIYKTESILEPSSLMGIEDVLTSARLKYPKWQHFYPPELSLKEPYWHTIKTHDVLLHVPYNSYQPVIKFISDAADDPNVISIKMTLYRTGRDSPIIAALQRAASNGKQVTVLVELKARFDEERNIEWASQLQKAGVIVLYGVVNLKVHAKILMIIRKENDRLQRYVHLATGNYNPRTAKSYCDLSLFTANPEIANDATLFFNILTGYSTLQTMKCLSMAPIDMKSKILTMIQREIDRSTPEKPGLIMAKMNSLTHEDIITALYKASCAGVKIMLNIRGICMLVPGIQNMSENITVISIVGRYLEHERVFYFDNGDTPEIYLSSADWMNRNLDRRIELMFPIKDHNVFQQVKEILNTYFEDNTNSHVLQSDGTWIRNTPIKNAPIKNAQETLYLQAKRKANLAAKKPKIEFEIRRND